ncbi:Antibiotic biosynthesis monooxygenase [Saccharopolyspora antimicrobica]|uniref:Antibiotic biosynthesis monooxygenase n=1 Tax=Saccharopolyspora antimicrobica TaxID=455193 RepID=A0A1I5GRI3_9PSEU|nr:antibiotic biosynthesis monooxygenase [Saccharopolyspora antimicrobica]SFO38543.1 Antibiotic biosynthesis monooxygenase [Saccharopolyspora antimicrobica]
MFTLRFADGARDRFIAAYQEIRHQVVLLDGCHGDGARESTAAPQEWMITEEWAILEHFQQWETA